MLPVLKRTVSIENGFLIYSKKYVVGTQKSKKYVVGTQKNCLKLIGMKI